MAKHNNSNICIVAGHSGGHILPCITIANKNYPDAQKNFITTNNGFDKKIITQATIHNSILELNTKKIPNKFYQLPAFSIKIFLDFINAIKFLNKTKPKAIITTGGLIAIQVCLAAKLLRIKAEIYELNVEPGKAIKFLANFFHDIKVCFPQTSKYFPKNTCTTVSYPVRFSASCIVTKDIALKNLNLDINKKTIFVLGGSQGSVSLNLAFKKFIESNAENNLQVIHQIGINDSFDWQDFYSKRQIPAITFSYNSKIEDFYQAADLIICRAGAGTLAEVAFFNKKCLAVPLETLYQASNL